MIYQVNNIKRDVRIALDEDRTSEALLQDGDSDVLKLDQIIESKIVEAVQRVHQEAPYYLLEAGKNFADRAVYWNTNDTSGWLILPNDFMRLVVYEMSDWERPVYGAISTLDPEYAKQRSRVKGIRGCAERPVVAIGMRPVGKVLEFYASKEADAQITKAVYVPYPVVDEYGGIDISERLYKAVVYTAAALTLISCGESERAKDYLELAKTLEV